MPNRASKRKSGLNGLPKDRILKKNIALEPHRPGGLEIEASRDLGSFKKLEKVKKEQLKVPFWSYWSEPKPKGGSLD